MGTELNSIPKQSFDASAIVTGTIVDARIAAAITRDTELTVHAGVADAHHAKTTSFADITDRAGVTKIEFTANKLLKGAGAGADPTEIDVPVAPTVVNSGSYTGNSAANRAIAHGLTSTAKVVFIVRGGAVGLFRVVVDHLYYEVQANGFVYAVTAMDATNFYVGNATSYAESANYDTYVYT